MTFAPAPDFVSVPVLKLTQPYPALVSLWTAIAMPFPDRIFTVPNFD